MRGTCARVLAAALMTGAIATVVGMAALFGTPTEGGRPISAPPSSLQRSIRLTAHLAPRHRPGAPRLVTVHTNHFRPVRQQAASGLAVTRTRHVAPRPRRQLTSVPKPEAAPVPAPAVAPTPADPPPPVTYEDDQGKDHGHGRGHAYGHDKQDE